MPIKGHWAAKYLMGLWLMSEGGDLQFYDLSGNQNTGTIAGNITWQPGKFGPCLDFAATTACPTIPHKSWLDFNGYTGSYTFIMSVKGASQAASYRLIEKLGGAGAYPIGIMGSAAGQPLAYIYDGTNNPGVSLGTVIDGNWHIIAFVVDNAADYLYGYNDGLLVGSTLNTVTAGTANTAPYYLGNRYLYDRDFIGQIGFIMAYNRALSTAEIARLYREPFCMFERTAIELWGRPTEEAPPAGLSIPVAMRYYRNRRAA